MGDKAIDPDDGVLSVDVLDVPALPPREGSGRPWVELLRTVQVGQGVRIVTASVVEKRRVTRRLSPTLSRLRHQGTDFYTRSENPTTLWIIRRG